MSERLCGTCNWWDERPVAEHPLEKTARLLNHDKAGACRLISSRRAHAAGLAAARNSNDYTPGAGQSYLDCEASFGCVSWEPASGLAKFVAEAPGQGAITKELIDRVATQ